MDSSKSPEVVEKAPETSTQVSNKFISNFESRLRLLSVNNIIAHAPIFAALGSSANAAALMKGIVSAETTALKVLGMDKGRRNVQLEDAS